MEKFNKTLRGYDVAEVNRFLDQVIRQVESMVTEIKEKNNVISVLQKQNEEVTYLKERVEQYERMEGTLKEAILMAQKTSDQMKINAQKHSEAIVTDAKNSANRIVNDALIKAEKAEIESDNLKRNMKIFKSRVKNLIEAQLEIVEDIELIEL